MLYEKQLVKKMNFDATFGTLRHQRQSFIQLHRASSDCDVVTNQPLGDVDSVPFENDTYKSSKAESTDKNCFEMERELYMG